MFHPDKQSLGFCAQVPPSSYWGCSKMQKKKMCTYFGRMGRHTCVCLLFASYQHVVGEDSIEQYPADG